MFKNKDSDPDFKMFKSDLNNGLFEHTQLFTHLPGAPIGKCDNYYDLLSDGLLPKYIRHCLKQCKYILTWEGNNYKKMTNIVETIDIAVQNAHSEDAELIKLYSKALGHSCSYDFLNCLDGFDGSELFTPPKINEEAKELSDRWINLGHYLEKRNFLEKFSQVNSSKSVLLDDYLASVAFTFLSNIRVCQTLSLSDSIALMASYYLIKKAENLSFIHAGKTKKKREVQSIDQFYIIHLLGYQSAKAYWGMVRDIFLKYWIYSYWRDNPKTMQKQIVLALQEKFPDGVSKSFSTVNELVGKLKRSGYLTEKWSQHNHFPNLVSAMEYASNNGGWYRLTEVS